MPYVSCPSCRLASYAVTPHSGRPLCPHCDAQLFPAAGAAPLIPPAPGSADATGDARAA
ncbi:MAG TPA: hypothetical protein VGO71_05515 [Baekduia sp.]|nr:hypothetical protein [Baekduia sp.]